jgi:hypothetical protein
MTTELNLTIRGETAADVMLELAMIGSRAAAVLGVGAPDANPDPPPEPPSKANGAEAAAPAKTRGKKAAAAPEPEPESVKGPDRAAIIDGLTKIYGRGDPAMRTRITEFRNGRGADRLRDLPDADLPAAAQLLADLKLAEAADTP